MTQYRNPIIHSTSPNVFAGDYAISQSALERYKVTSEHFGSTRVILSPSVSYYTKDYPYRLDDGAIGMRVVPVSDKQVVQTSDGRVVPGFQVLDEHLREAMGLEDDDPIFAYLSYFHPEQNEGTLKELAAGKGTVKPQLGFTHVGSYLGSGLTMNAPVFYHHHRFGVDGHANGLDGYPAHASFISLPWVPQKTLNANATLACLMLNHGVNFPPDYLKARCRPADLNTMLMFYRDWILDKDYLRTDSSWFTYCFAHESLISTIMLNLPHNEAAFCEVYGTDGGKELFAAFKNKYYNAQGFDFLDTDETDFLPLWKKEGLTQDQIKPFTLETYNAYEKARHEGTVDRFKGQKPLDPTRGTPWGPMYAAEIVFEFCTTYADMPDCGAIATTAIILGFMEEVDQRMGLGEVEYLTFAMPIVQKLMLADARVKAKANSDSYLADTFKALYAALGGKGAAPESAKEAASQIQNKHDYEELKSKFKSVEVAAIAAWAMLDVVEHWKEIIEQDPLTIDEAYDQFREDTGPDIQKACVLPIAETGRIEYNMVPATLHLIGNDAYAHNPLITVNTVCTAVQEKDVCIKA